MKKSFLFYVFMVSVITLIAVPAVYSASPVIINEFRRAVGGFIDHEYIEFVLTQDQTAAQLESLYFGDSTAATAAKYGIYKFQNLSTISAAFKAGTIIVIGGGTTPIPTEDIVYNPIPTGTDDDWNIKLQVSLPRTYINWVSSSPAKPGDFAASDIVWIDSSNTGTTSLDSINWDSTPGVFGAAAKVTISAPSEPESIEFTGNISGLNITANYAADSTGSMGLPNGGDNTTWIKTMRNPVVVTSKAPSANAMNILKNADIVVQFDENIDVATLTDSTFNIDGSISGRHTSAFSGGGTDTITANPDNDFAAGETVTVTLTTGIKSTGGAGIAKPVTWQFTVKSAVAPANFAGVSKNFGTGSDQTLSVAFGDADGNGDLDIAVGNLGEQHAVYLNNGSGNFLTAKNFGTASDNIFFVVFGDADGDGDSDIATGDFGDQNAVYLNDGNFTTAKIFGTGSDGTNSVAFGDAEGDGDLDIAVGNVSQQNMVYLNDGAGNFTAGTRNFGSGSDATYSVAFGDVNGDGYLDIAAGKFNQQNVVYLNDGAGNFTAGTKNFGTGSDATYSVAFGDVNGDGYLDIAAGNYNQQNVMYLNDGSGNFTAAKNFGTGNDKTYSISLGDIDGDGDLDIATGNENQQNEVYLNDGSGNFTTSKNFGTGTDRTLTVGLGDADGDGDLDIAVGNHGQQNVIYLNVPEVQFTTVSQSYPENTATMTITAQLSAVSSVYDVTVPFTVTGTAANGTDYTITASHVTIPAGSLSADITITVNNDLTDEPDETVIITMGTPTNAGKGATTVHTATITDDDPAPAISINDVTVTEGNSGTVNMDWTVSLSCASAFTVTVDYTAADNTATIADSDYTAISNTLTFNPGDTTKTVSVSVNGDISAENTETFYVNLSNPSNAAISDNQGIGTINNDDNFTPTTSGISNITVNEDSANSTINLLTSFNDTEDGTGLTYSVQSNSSGLVTTGIAGGNLTLAYTANANGTANITIRATDTGTLYAETTFTVAVNAVNDNPVINSQNPNPLSINEDTPLTIALSSLNITDADSSGFTLTVQNGSDYTVSGNTVTPSANFNGNLTVPVKVNDGSADSAVFNLSVTVNGVNDAPVINSQNPNPLSTDEDTPLTIALSSLNITDADSSSFTLTVQNGSDYTVSGTTIIPSANFSGNLTVPVFVNDGSADSAVFNLSVTVNAVNDAPVITGQNPLSTNEDMPLTIALSSLNITDADSSSFTLTVQNGADYTVSGTTITPSANFNGNLTVPVKVNDGGIDSNIFNLAVNLIPVNDPPVANNDTYNTNEDTPLNGDVLSNDTDIEGSSLTAVLINGTSHGTLSLNGNGSFTYKPSANYNGSDSFTYKANDGSVDSNTAFVTITVISVNDDPVANNDAYTVAEDEILEMTRLGVLSNDTDSDGNFLTAVKVANPSHGTLDFNENGSFTYSPFTHYNGTDSFTYKANDGTANSETATVLITVLPVNNFPVATDDSYVLAEDTALAVNADNGVLSNDADIEEDALKAVKITDPAHGKLAMNDDGSFTYTPNSDYSGSDAFTYRADDGTSDSNIAKVYLTVDPTDDAPSVANPISDVITDEDSEDTLIDLSNVFADKDLNYTGIYCFIQNNSNTGLVSTDIEGDNLILTYPSDKNGTAEITVRGVSNGISVDDMFEVTVNPVNDLPVISLIPDQNTDDTVSTEQLNFTVSDKETPAEKLTVTGRSSNHELVSDDDILIHGTLTNRTVTVTPTPDTAGTAIITLMVTDEDGGEAESSFMLTVTKGPDIDSSVITVTTESGSDETAPGGIIRYTAVISNTGDRPAEGVIFSNAIPEHTTLIASGIRIEPPDSGKIVSTNPVSVTEITVPENGEVSIIFEVRVNDDVHPGDVISDNGMILYDSDNDGISDAEWKSGDIQITVREKAYLTAAKSVENLSGSHTAYNGDTLEYKIILKNNGAYDIDGAEFSDTIPVNTAYIQGSAEAPAGSTVKEESSVLRITNISVPAHGEAIISFHVKIMLYDCSTEIANQAEIKYDSDGDGINETVAETAGNSVINLIIPVASCDPSGVGFTTATLNGIINPGGTAATYYFEYGTTPDYRLTTPVQSAGSDHDNLYADAFIEGLDEGTEYHYRLVTVTGGGILYGEDTVFTTEYAAPGIDGIHKNSTSLKAWATGWADPVNYGALFFDRFKKPENALGKPDALESSGFVSLGTRGSIVLTFDKPITDGSGYDFAVFGDSPEDDRLELAYVEVSSDGVNFVRFDNESLNNGNTYGTSDPSLIAGFAGKYRLGYGTCFDLSSLKNKNEVKDGTLNILRITHVKITDVHGGFDRDAQGNMIYDAYYSLESSRAGFDLDAVGVIHEACAAGDVNNDVDVNLKDAVLTLKILSDISAGNICISADVNGDMKIGIEELLYILRKTLDL